MLQAGRIPYVVKSCSWVIVVVFLRVSMVSSQQCIFVNVTDNTYTVRCNVSSSAEIKLIPKQNQITSLMLSKNNLTTLLQGNFKNFGQLRYLYLDHNYIKTIEEGAFRNLTSLAVLDLSYNKLSSWKGSWLKDLPSLHSLNLYNNDNLQLKKDDLVSTYTSIFGANIAGSCNQCNLTRVVNVSKAMLIKKMLGQFIRQCIYYPEKEEDAKAQDAIEEVARKYVLFTGTCRVKPPKLKNCDLHLTSKSLLDLERYFKDRCYRGARALRPIVFLFGSIGFILNFFVITAILTLKRLRHMVPFLLVAHLSFCDFLTGIYAIGTASGHEVSPDFHDIRQYRESDALCGTFWVIFLLGQTLGVLTCVLVTIERFLATVYCMKPDLKLETRSVLIILPVFWVIALLIGLPLQQIDLQKITINFMCVLLRDYSKKKGFFVSQGLMIAYLILYIVIVALYLRIYLFVRKSSRQVSVKREAKLAKRIGLIVLTNFICFALPNLSMLIFTTAGLYAPLDDIPNTIIRRWVPPMFLVLNATANPCFFAFGNKLFSSAVKGALRRFLIKYLEFDSYVLQSSKVHPSEGGSKTRSTAAVTNTRRVANEESTNMGESHA